MRWTKAEGCGLVAKHVGVAGSVPRDELGSGREACEGAPHREGKGPHDEGAEN